jgi:putative oxidoreductase
MILLAFLSFVSGLAGLSFFGSIGMALGLLSRIAAFGLMCNMAVATMTVHWKNGFLLSSGQPGGGAGYEYTFTLFFMALTILIGGAGNLSVDRMIATKAKPRVAGFAPAT